jgi:hypothetical protein
MQRRFVKVKSQKFFTSIPLQNLSLRKWLYKANDTYKTNTNFSSILWDINRGHQFPFHSLPASRSRYNQSSLICIKAFFAAVQLTLTLARAVTHFSHLIVCLGRRRIDGTATKHVFNALSAATRCKSSRSREMRQKFHIFNMALNEE